MLRLSRERCGGRNGHGRTLRPEEFAGDVELLAAHHDDLLAVEQLLRDGAGQATEKVALAVNDNLYQVLRQRLCPYSSVRRQHPPAAGVFSGMRTTGSKVDIVPGVSCVVWGRMVVVVVAESSASTFQVRWKRTSNSRPWHSPQALVASGT